MAYLAGKQAFLRILQQEGVSVMFGNPGTTELPLSWPPKRPRGS
jgi:benzoylformate decarboxylase